MPRAQLLAILVLLVIGGVFVAHRAVHVDEPRSDGEAAFWKQRAESLERQLKVKSNVVDGIIKSPNALEKLANKLEARVTAKLASRRVESRPVVTVSADEQEGSISDTAEAEAGAEGKKEPACPPYGCAANDGKEVEAHTETADLLVAGPTTTKRVMSSKAWFWRGIDGSNAAAAAAWTSKTPARPARQGHAMVLVDLAYRARAVQSSTIYGNDASFANDGVQTGYIGGAGVAQTMADSAQWWEVELDHHAEVESVEAWLPIPPCYILHHRIHQPCGGFTFPFSGLTLDVSDGARTTTVSRNLSGLGEFEGGVVGFDALHRKAKKVRLRPFCTVHECKGAMQLSEVRVWGYVQATAATCRRFCQHGTCVCADPASSKASCVPVCMCEKNYDGPACSFWVPRDWHYLPPAEHLLTNDKTFELKFATWMNEVHRLQHNTCDNDEIAKLYRPLTNPGIGSMMLQLVALFARTMRGHERLHVATEQNSDFKWTWAGVPFCKDSGATFDCFFDKFTSCRPKKMPDLGDTPYVTEQDELFHAPPSLSTDPRLRMDDLTWHAVALSYMMKLNKRTQKRLNLQRVKREIGFEHPIVGMHIRHGDSCYTSEREGHCVPLAKYIPALAAVCSRYNISRVFLSTDDAKVIAESKQYPQFQFIHAPSDLSGYENKDFMEFLIEKKQLKLDKVVWPSLLDMYLLGETDVLVGHMQSGFSRVALALSTARAQRMTPYVSMDGPWCHHWRMCCDQNLDGTSVMC